jgi:DNA-binding MarR family transcriptional regulator
VAPARDDVRLMVAALFLLTDGLERARRQRKTAAALSLLQVIAGHEDGIRPSDIADRQLVDPSLVTRQVRELENADYVRVAPDPSDARSWLVTLTPAGMAEMQRLQEVGLDRFALFVDDWEPGEVRELAGLLVKLRASMAAVGERERRSAARRERPEGAARPGAARRRDGNRRPLAGGLDSGPRS